ncbi:CHAP domain-containing protein [soil metagenome]
MRKTTRTLVGSLCAAMMLFSTGGAASAADNWQCVPFARMISGIQLFGDAWTWWGQAVGNYPTGYNPTLGSVLVFRPQGAMKLGHVSVVSKIVTERVIQVTHANWSLIEGHRGQVEENVTVVDVSQGGDWSAVKVWYDPSRDLGTTTYNTYGFIYQKPGAGENMVFAAARNATGTALNQMASVLPLASPGQIMAQAAESTDRIAGLIQQVLSGDTAKK